MRRLAFIARLAGLVASTGTASLLVASPLARAAPGGLPAPAGHADTSPEWERIKGRLFASKPVDAASGAVRLTAPLRAAYGASVPVRINTGFAQTAERHVKRLYLVVDKNPSPIAAVIDLTLEAGQADVETRLRVDEYSHVRVVAELSDGSLHTDSRYVKTSGGCSAPPNRDSPELIGRTVLKLAGPVALERPTTADVTVIHPNDTGFELNQLTVMFIPPHFVRSIRVSYAGRKIFDAELDFSLSENPTLRFQFVPHGEGVLKAEVEDTKEGRWTGTLAVASPASTSTARAVS